MGADIEITPVTDESGLGPHMKALTPLQRNFVLAIQASGRGRWGRAAQIAGFKCTTQRSFDQIGYALSINPKITAALMEVGGYTVQTAAIDAALALIDVMNNPDQPKANVKLKAANSVLDRVGIVAKTEHTVNVNQTNMTQERMLVELKALLRTNPSLIAFVDAPIRKLLEPPKEEAIDAEFSEVTAEPADPDADLLGE